MKRLTREDVHARKVAELGLNPAALDLTSIEAIAGALRRVASFLCPCASATLVRGIMLPLKGLVDDFEAVKDQVESTLEAMIAHGDILEHRDFGEGLGERGDVLLYAAPASFMLRQSGALIVLGMASDQLSALPDELESRIEYINHVRRLSPLPGEDLRHDLTQLGLIELTYDSWLKTPQAETAADHLSRLNRQLDLAEFSRDVPGLSLLDPEQPVHYYRGRWVEPRRQTGRFVARRKQAYGADLWCYVQLRNGQPERLIDLLTFDGRWRGCDEAWRLQMAIDAGRGTPQGFRVHSGPHGTAILELFSPVPKWARRRWDAVGEPVLSTACLFAYRFTKAEIQEELRFARDVLWIQELR